MIPVLYVDLLKQASYKKATLQSMILKTTNILLKNHQKINR